MQTVCVQIKNYSSKTPSNVKSEFLTTWANAITAVFSGSGPGPDPDRDPDPNSSSPTSWWSFICSPFFNRRARWAVVSVREGFSMSFLALVSPSGMNKILWGNLSDGEQVEFRDAFNRAYHDHDYQFMNQRQLKIQGPFIWSQVFKTTLPSSFPGRANFWLISLDNSTNRLPETGELVSGAGQLDRECCPASARHRFLAYTLRLAWGTTRDRVFWVREETDEGTAVTTHNSR